MAIFALTQMDHDENRPIFKAAIQLCDELANLLGTATGVEEKTRHKISDNGEKIDSWRNSARRSENIDKFSKEKIFSLEIAQSIVKSTSQLTTTAKKINSKCKDFRLRSLIQVITKQHIEAAIRLIERYKIFSINVHCLLCQQQLNISLTDIERSLERMISVCSKLYPNRRRLEELIVPASATQEALNSLRNIRILKRGNGNGDRYCGFVEEPTDMTQSARILGEATAQVLLAIKEIIKEKPRWKGKTQLIEGAKALSETTSNMVKYAQLSIWYSELKHMLCSIENYDDMIRNQCTNNFLEILQFTAKESTKFSVTCLTLAQKIYNFKKTLIAFAFNNESLSLIYAAEKLVTNIKTANTTPLTSQLYKEILQNSKEFIQDATWVLDSFRNIISNFTVKT